MKKKILIVSTFVLLMGIFEAFSQTFNKSKDLLLANYDLKPDDDDVQSAAALASMLKHPDFDGVNYFATAGAYGIQSNTFKFINTAVPGFFNTLFGPENEKWTNADGDWEGSVNRVKEKVVDILKNGGKVWVPDGGQSDFTYDIVQAAMDDGVSAAIVRDNVIVVQHSNWNEKNTTQTELNWLRENVDYRKIPDGNSGGNGSAEYKSTNKKWMNQALASSMADARTYWTLAKEITDDWTRYNNPTIKNGGVDFSDTVEVWSIFKLGNDLDDVASFWSRYITGVPLPVVIPVHIKKRNATNFAMDGGKDGQNRQNLKLWGSDEDNENQLWVEIDRGNGFYSYQKIGTPFCIDGGNNGGDGQNVYIYACSDNNENQHWKKEEVGNNAFRLIKRNAPDFALNGGPGGDRDQNIALGLSSSTRQDLHWFIDPVNTLSTDTIEGDLPEVAFYPNPVIASAILKNASNSDFRIYDINGRLVFTKSISSESEAVNLSELFTGIYFAEVIDNAKKSVLKIIKN